MSKPTEQKPFNTRRLQIFELNHFMACVYDAIFDGVGFTNPGEGTQYSFEQAVTLYNDREDKDNDVYCCDRVKLRYAKKQKRIICTDHLVKAGVQFREVSEENGYSVEEGIKGLQRILRLR